MIKCIDQKSLLALNRLNTQTILKKTFKKSDGNQYKIKEINSVKRGSNPISIIYR